MFDAREHIVSELHLGIHSGDDRQFIAVVQVQQRSNNGSGSDIECHAVTLLCRVTRLEIHEPMIGQYGGALKPCLRSIREAVAATPDPS